MTKKKDFDVTKSRFSDASWFGNPTEIIIGGVGGIGSWVALFLARIGHELYMFDMDNVEEVNLAGQLYSSSDIGRNKAEACKRLLSTLSPGCKIHTTTSAYVESSIATPIMFSCFDNMDARRLLFNNWKAQEDRELFVDGRMLAETGMLYTVQKGQEKEYEATLFADSEVQDAPCSFKATSHCGAFIGSLMTGTMNNYLGNKSDGADIRIIPFEVQFELPFMNFSVIRALEAVVEEAPVEKVLADV